jgi:hypothetical protein
LNIKKIIMATLSYVVLTMAIAYPWHLMWFHDLYIELGAYTRATPSIPLGILSMLVQGVVIAYLYPFYYRSGNPTLNGVTFSLMMGFVVYSVMGFAMAAKVDINPISTYLTYNAVFQFIQYVVTGIALGLIYGRK